MGRGILLAELIRAQQLHIPMLTSDPADPPPYRPWIRTDLDGDPDKMGEFRYSDGSSTKRAWVMSPNSTPSGVEEYWKAEAPAGPVVIPLAPRADAVHTDQSWEFSSGTYGVWSPPELSVETLPPTDVSTDSATLEGDVVDMVFVDAADAYFQWRETGAATWTETQLQQLTQPQVFDEAIQSLTEDAEYEYRALAEADDYSDMGDIETFTATPAIPDSVVSRPDDNESGDYTTKYGLRINTSQNWTSIGAEISNNTSGATRAQIYRVSDGTLMGETDISGLGAGDTFTVNDVGLSADTDFNFVLDDNGDEYTAGYLNSDDANYPYTSSDGNLEIVAQAEGETGGDADSAAISLKRVGNVGFD